MSEKRGWGSTVLGWFVVREEDGAAPDPFATLPDSPVTAETAAPLEPQVAFAFDLALAPVRGSTGTFVRFNSPVSRSGRGS